MSVCSIEFLASLMAVSAVFFHLPSSRLRQCLLTLCNAGFLYLLIPNGPSWALLGALLLSGYLAGHALRRWPGRLGLALYLLPLVAAFVWLKKYDFLAFFLPDWVLGHPVSIVFLSYLLFRQIHFVVDMMQGQIAEPSLWSYLNYQLNLFTLLSGPIQRYQEFGQYWRQPRPLLRDGREMLAACLRILIGVVKIAVIAGVCLAVYDKGVAWFESVGASHAMPLRLATALRFALMFYLYPAYVYFNFAGYCDIVIGGAALLGMQLPENFDRPYLARNMIDFWTRWHRTLSFWIRDYLFTPLYKTIAENWPRRAQSLTFLCYFVALFLAGVWHGSTWNFAVFGLVHAVGVSAVKLWESQLLRRGGRQGLRRYLESRRIRTLAVVANFHFACLTFLFFPAELDRCLRMLGTFFRVVA